MLGFLLDPVEDELLYGVLARTRAALGGPSFAKFATGAFGSTPDAIAIDLPGNLRSLAGTYAFGGYADLVLGHTNYAYHARWLGQAARATLDGYMASGRPFGAWKGVLLHCAAAPKQAKLAFCPDCADADLARRGWSVWRRQHQLPGISVCLAHDRRLASSGVATTGQRRFVEGPPTDGGLPIPCPLDMPSARRFALASDAIRLHPGSPAEPSRIKASFRRLMLERGWLARNGMTKAFIWDALDRRYGPAFTQSLGLDNPSARIEFQSMWSGAPRRRFPAFWRMLLLDFLEAGPEAVLPGYDGRGP